MSNVRKRKQRNLYKEQEEIFSQQGSTIQIDPQNKNKYEQTLDNLFDPAKLAQNLFDRDAKKQKQEDEQGNQNQNQKAQENDNQLLSSIKKKRKMRKKKDTFLQSYNNQMGQGDIVPLSITKKKKPLEKQEQERISDNQEKKEEVWKFENMESKIDAPGIVKNTQPEEQQQKNQLQPDQQQQDQGFDEMIKKKREEITVKEEQMISFKDLLDEVGQDKQLKKRIIYAPIANGERAVCFFKRYQSGLSQTYQLIGQDSRPLLFAENQRGSIGCNTYISLTKQMDKNSVSYVGKLRGNASGSLYHLYDKGQQPTSSKDRSKWRVSMASIQYQSNFMGMKGPRRVSVFTPKIKSEQQWDSFKLSQSETLEKFPEQVIIKYRNKQPRWNQKLKSYALNFGGRVKLASIKNFILIEDKFKNEEEVDASPLLIFGKIDENTFSLQFTHPLSLFQSFGIALSQFDFKLNCQ